MDFTKMTDKELYAIKPDFLAHAELGSTGRRV
jgi:hypothetical protein